MNPAVWKHLPGDIVIEILSWLPVKTLIRLRSVCKSWYSTITHPSFITTHLNRAPSSSYSSDGSFQNKTLGSCNFVSPPLVNQARFDFPLKFFKPVGTISGLICLSDMRRNNNDPTTVLWNPSIRKIKTLPTSSISVEPRHPDTTYSVILGFGFHRPTNEYKVVRILRASRNRGAELLHQVEVYTLSTDSWRKIEADIPWFVNHQRSSAFIHGAVHWVGFRRVGNKFVYMIISFDIGDELFREMVMPNAYIDGYGVWPAVIMDIMSSHMDRGFGMEIFSLAVLKDWLALLASSPHEDDRGSGRYCLWAMREYGVAESWTKLFTIEVPQTIIWRTLLGSTQNNELVLETRDGQCVSYDPQSLKFKDLGLCRIGCTCNAVSFVQTLVLLEGGNALFGQDKLLEGICLGKRKSSMDHLLRKTYLIKSRPPICGPHLIWMV